MIDTRKERYLHDLPNSNLSDPDIEVTIRRQIWTDEFGSNHDETKPQNLPCLYLTRILFLVSDISNADVQLRAQPVERGERETLDLDLSVGEVKKLKPEAARIRRDVERSARRATKLLEKYLKVFPDDPNLSIVIAPDRHQRRRHFAGIFRESRQ